MKLRSIILQILKFPYSLLQYLGSQALKAIHDRVFQKELEQKHEQQDARNRQLQDSNQQKQDLKTEMAASREGQKEINELLQRGHTFLGFKEVKKSPDPKDPALCTIYFVYRQISESDFRITAHYPGQFKKLRDQLKFGVDEPENNKHNGVHLLELKATYGKEMEITDILTHSDYRGVGIAGLALDQVKEIAREQNIQVLHGIITSYSNPKDRKGLRGFYRKYGFTVTNNESNGKNDTFRLELQYPNARLRNAS